jgi:hypothetical protein
MTPPRSNRQIIILAAVLTAFLIGAVVYGVRIWGELDDTSMSASGDVALALGVVAATALGAGLMGLVFYSSRHGFDDDAGVSWFDTVPPHDDSDKHA